MSTNNKNQVYLRVKRRNQTYCLLCDATDSLADLQQTIFKAVTQHDGNHKNELAPSSLRLLDATRKVLGDDDDDDSATLESLGLQDDALLFVVFPVADGEWEAVDVVNMTDAATSSSMVE